MDIHPVGLECLEFVRNFGKIWNTKLPGVLMSSRPASERSEWRKRLNIVIFGSDTPSGKAFDVVLLVLIILSILCVSLESVESYREQHGDLFRAIEWFFTGLFAIEYCIRLLVAPRPLKYATSFFGVIDLLSIIPTFLSLYFVGSQTLIVIRVFRLLRVFRIFQMATFFRESKELLAILHSRGHKITVFIASILTLIVIIGAAMYVVEGPENGFSSIPVSIYWAVVTLTTVGYGDITPLTTAGKILASAIMLLGYGIIAVPASIMTAEIGKAASLKLWNQKCTRCGESGHLKGSRFCHRCGMQHESEPLNPA